MRLINRSGICQLTCPDCRKKYTGQSGRSFRKRCDEHFQSSKYQNPNYTFSEHTHDTRYSFGPMEHIMNVLHFVKKGKLMNFLDKLYIYSQTTRNNQINEESTTGSNKIHDVVIQHEKDRRWLRVCAWLPIYSFSESPQFSAGKHRSTTTF